MLQCVKPEPPMSQLGHERDLARFAHVRFTPNRVANSEYKFSRQERIPSDVANASNFDRSTHARKFHLVRLAERAILSTKKLASY